MESVLRVAFQIQDSATWRLLSPHMAELHIPGGFPYQAYNAAGILTPMGMLTMTEYCNTLLYYHEKPGNPGFLDLYKFVGLEETRVLLFTAATRCHIEPETYDPKIKKSPLRVVIELVHIGRSTYTTVAKFYVPGISKPIIVTTVLLIFVDLKARKPVQGPDWWMRKFASPEVRSSKRAFHFEVISLNEDDVNNEILEHSFTIPISDCDFNLHSNFSCYSRYYLDALNTALVRKHSGLGALRFARNVKEFSIVFRKEASQGDKLNIRFQRSAECDDKYNFILLNPATSKVISNCTMAFYKNDVKSNL